MSKGILHVVPHDDTWGVKREGNERSSSTHATQKEAIESARSLAHEGDDIVIHRPDGTIRERVTYTSSNGNGNGQTPLQPRDVVSVGSRVSWPAMIAGLAVTFTVYVCLILLAVAIGASTMDYVQNRTFGIWAAIIGIVSLMAALFLGGFVTSRLSTRENWDEAIVYGVVLSASFFFVQLVTGMNLGGSLAQMAELTRPPTVEVRAEREFPSAEVQRRRDEAAARGEQLVADMNPATLAWWAFGGMVLSVLAAIGGAVTGAGPELVFRQAVVRQPEGRPAVEPAT